MRQLEKMGGVRVYHAGRNKTFVVPITTFNDKRLMARLGYTEIREEAIPQAPPKVVNLEVKDVADAPKEESPKEEPPKAPKKTKTQKSEKATKTLTKDELKKIATDGN